MLCLTNAFKSADAAAADCGRFFLGGISNGLQGFSFKGAGPIDRRRVVRPTLIYRCLSSKFMKLEL